MMDVPLFASVATGFETVAKEEVNRVINVKGTAKRGHVRFEANPEQIKEVLNLRSVDNVYAVLYDHAADELLNENEEEALDFIKSQFPRVNWSKAVEWWEMARNKQVYGGAELIKEHMKEFITDGKLHEVTERSPTFRVTCNRAGNKKEHSFSSMTVARKVGAQVNTIFGWKPDMKNFDIEIVVNIRQNEMLMMIALNRETMFKRNVVAFGPTTLRSTLCYCMVALARSKKGDVLLDPMCGGGSIAIEGALAFPGIHFLGGDNHPKAIERCILNRDHVFGNKENAGPSGPDFSVFDATNLPLRDNCINAVVTDMPFGMKIGSTDDNRLVYPELLKEWERVVVPGGRAVILTKDKRTIERVLREGGLAWHLESSHMVNVGGLTALCGVLVNKK